MYGIPLSKSIKANKTNITYFEYVFGEKVYIIVQDPNDKNICNWKIVKSFCEKLNIEFTNQTFPSLIKTYLKQFIDSKSERIEFGQEYKQKILNKFNSKCNICKEECSNDFDIDHIKPLASGGTNYLSNLQVLCKSCHKIKSQSEHEDGSYVKIIETESSFNKQVQEIMDSELSFRYAFIEHFDYDEDKYQTTSNPLEFDELKLLFVIKMIFI